MCIDFQCICGVALFLFCSSVLLPCLCLRLLNLFQLKCIDICKYMCLCVLEVKTKSEHALKAMHDKVCSFLHKLMRLMPNSIVFMIEFCDCLLLCFHCKQYLGMISNQCKIRFTGYFYTKWWIWCPILLFVSDLYFWLEIFLFVQHRFFTESNLVFNE